MVAIANRHEVDVSMFSGTYAPPRRSIDLQACKARIMAGWSAEVEKNLIVNLIHVVDENNNLATFEVTNLSLSSTSDTYQISMSVLYSDESCDKLFGFIGEQIKFYFPGGEYVYGYYLRSYEPTDDGTIDIRLVYGASCDSEVVTGISISDNELRVEKRSFHCLPPEDPQPAREPSFLDWMMRDFVEEA